jgi:hypothetical protein
VGDGGGGWYKDHPNSPLRLSSRPPTGRLLVSKGNNRILGPSVNTVQQDRSGTLLQIDIEASKAAANSQEDPSSCPSTPSILHEFSDGFDISSDFDIDLSDEYQGPSVVDTAGSKHSLALENEHMLGRLPTKRLWVRINPSFIEYLGCRLLPSKIGFHIAKFIWMNANA